MAEVTRRRSIKAGKTKEKNNKLNEPELLTLQDLQCTVCMGIFVEPVTLPCYHTTCKVCFEKTIDNNTLACPLCRKYVGTWVRQRQKKDMMVNQNLWLYIKKNYNTHVQKKLKGEDDEVIDELMEKNIQTPKICEAGVIRREYEAEKKRLEEEAVRRREMETEASEKLIRELQEQEERERRHLEELKRKAEEEDALIAQQIADQLEAEDARKAEEEEESLRRLLEEEEQVSSAFVRLSSSQNLRKGPMDAFLSQINAGKQSRAGSSSSTDSLYSEMNHFRPLHYVPTTPPKSSPDGSDGDNSLVFRPVPVMRSLDGCSSSPTSGPSSLRPWLVKGSPISSVSPQEDTPLVASLGEKRQRSSSDSSENSPKKIRRGSPRKELTTQSVQSKVLEKRKLLSGKKKIQETDSDQITVKKGEFKLVNGQSISPVNPQSHTSSGSSSSSKSQPPTGVCDIEKSFLPLSIQDISDCSELEGRYRQEQEDYELALKLQAEIDALDNRGYALRSVVSSSPKKKQPNIVTPRRKVKLKSPSSSDKKSKRRQCTLEESIGFSVKMEM